MLNRKLGFAILLFLNISMVRSEVYCPVVEVDGGDGEALTKIYYLPTTYTSTGALRDIVDKLKRVDFLKNDSLSIAALPSSNSYNGPGSSEYDGLALAIAEKVLERDSAAAGTAIDPHVDNVINFYNNGITNRQAVDIYRAGTNNGILTEPESGFSRDISDEMGYVIGSEMRKTIERQREQLQEGVEQVKADMIAGHRLVQSFPNINYGVASGV
ncbi:hypothetical protein GCM10011297_20080 [Bacterioplanes sanyensis]|uniref:hypothetical protein n=1 Tax=Bacterioplanes sanyensis TaxID=1249553 RepID=UPI001675785B|nr:hypothetical protein [Bacterioplanes sanyensis]GGY47101.1 hypothetical protein GCM10011297_20080 [Bacterioplanes sanyensis]